MARRPRKDRAAESPPAANAFRAAALPAPRPRFELAGESGRAALLARALRLLEDHGVAVVHEAAHAALLASGARPGREPARLRLPRGLVEEALAATPKEVRLAGKRPDRDVTLPRGDHGFVMRTGTGAHGFIEIGWGDFRNMEISDVATIARLATGLDEVGARVDERHPRRRRAGGQHRQAHLAPALQRRERRVPREEPIASMIMCSFTPLEFKVMDVEALIQCGRAGLPVHACSLPSAGGTAPLSVAGNVLMALAEILAMVTMGHVLAPGTPIIATPLMFTLDMATGQALHACPESLQAKALAVEVLHGLGLVTHTYGMGSDTPAADRQSMAERAMLGQMVAMAGCDILGGVGQLQTATVFDPVQAVLDNELGGYLRALVALPDLGEAAFNWDEVSEIGIGGHFLSSEQTLALCRSQYRPGVFRCDRRDDYDKAGRLGAWEAARDKARALIAADPPSGLPDDAARAEIAALRARADVEIAGKATVAGRRAVI